MNNAPNLPRIIKAAIKAIAELPAYIVKSVYSVGSKRQHRMHAQRRRTLQRLLASLLAHVDLCSGKLVSTFGNRKYDFSLEAMAEDSGLARSTVCAILAYLKAIGCLLVYPQGRAVLRFDNGSAQLSCSVSRVLSPHFWRLLGLEDAVEQEQERRAERMHEDDKVFHLVRIRGRSGVHAGHDLPIPPRAPASVSPSPMDDKLERERAELHASIQRARAAAAQRQN